MPYTHQHTVIAARCFIREVFSEMTPAEADEIRRRNDAETDPRICHSHDFTDSNTAMELAIFHATGIFTSDHTPEQQEDLGLRKLWDDAWAMAKAARFIPTSLPQQTNPLTIDEIMQLPGLHDIWINPCPANPLLKIKAHFHIEMIFRDNPDGRAAAEKVSAQLDRPWRLRGGGVGGTGYSITHLILRENP